MAGSSLLALIDDIATLLDDISVMTKVAAKKTAGVLGDDLAVNAERVTGVRAERELPVVWAVAKGSAVNKLILVPAALLISAVLPWAVTPLLMLGGAYLCYEGFEKLAHHFLHSDAEDVAEHDELLTAVDDVKAHENAGAEHNPQHHGGCFQCGRGGTGDIGPGQFAGKRRHHQGTEGADAGSLNRRCHTGKNNAQNQADQQDRRDDAF